MNTACEHLAKASGCWVEVIRTEGSVPREAGTWMLVTADALAGTIGGGHLEFDATAQARALVAQGGDGFEQRFALGPSLGQCCGGVVWLRFTPLAQGGTGALRALASRSAERLAPALQVALFGAGHVGHALVELLARLPCRLMWIDSRDAVFAPRWLQEGSGVACEHSAPVEGAVAGLAPHSQVLIMSFSHAEDLEVVAACLQRQRQRADLDFIGLIGSATKWAVFRRRLAQRGFTEQELDQVTCPIGLPGITGKEPEVIAVAVAAQLLQRRPN
ncbi:xanthine dehydrogenase accessory protein XdhC [Acidovorax sp. D4N7]|uniref:Xanthine dehydrogenase accessory protein XdhC n=1 Tax=Comamonas endophytica TaxID=2949090 RepID=A0ABY6GDZ1_9BURK|nr:MULTISPECIES: xanthine dehydrogenase accessory protein XdhC [unclassified Acidovorax]MCD2511506.1 xanthine dehydrogenase accessory protein XdhC [Acidovorax sp. D4N7]UYG53323.1 xanthine dehydrogenase accessory protein XdhC [Acidovorax sp. 5MLIR]